MPLWNLPESDMACSKACTKHDDIAKSGGAEVMDALGGTDTSDLRVSFRQALSFSTPTHSLSQLWSQWIFTPDFRCSPGGPWGNRRQCSESDENVHQRSREERPEYRQNLFCKLTIKPCFWDSCVPVGFRECHRTTKGQWNVQC
jgi:hypothetical protein